MFYAKQNNYYGKRDKGTSQNLFWLRNFRIL